MKKCKKHDWTEVATPNNEGRDVYWCAECGALKFTDPAHIKRSKRQPNTYFRPHICRQK